MAKEGKSLLLELANKLTGTSGQPTLPSHKKSAEALEKLRAGDKTSAPSTEGFSRPNDGYPIRKSQDAGSAAQYPGTRKRGAFNKSLKMQPPKR